jgi:hypothetical protein
LIPDRSWFDAMQPGWSDRDGRTCAAPVHWTRTTGLAAAAELAAKAVPAAVAATAISPADSMIVTRVSLI